MRRFDYLIPRSLSRSATSSLGDFARYRDSRFLINLVIVLFVALALGIGSAWYLVDRGFGLTTQRVGPWAAWTSAGRPDADPYTKAHLARSGRLPITAASAVYYLASTDDDGRALRPDCEYAVEGRPLNASWWSIAVYDEDGRLLPNPAGRHAFSNHDMARSPDGGFRLTLAPNARPGNWLPTGGNRELRLALRAYASRSYTWSLQEVAARLPRIVRVACP